MNLSKKVGVIVDGYSSGGEFAAAFKKYGIECVHVQSNATIPDVYKSTFKPQDYSIKLIYDKNINLLVEEIKKYNPIFIIPGAEPGIKLADELASYFDVPKNPLSSSPTRRNKYLMMEMIKSKGLHSIPEFKSSKLNEIISFANEQNQWPLIVKPMESAGGDGFKICHNELDIVSGFNTIMNNEVNLLGIKNNEVLMQHYIDGEEYVVNTVSVDGKHTLCELWKYNRYKNKNENIYNTASLINYDESIHHDLIRYAFHVADALEVNYGPLHMEIMMHNNIPVMIEAGARVMGAQPFYLMQECLNKRNQSFMTIQAYADLKRYHEMSSSAYKVYKNMVIVFLVSRDAGTLKRINYLPEIQALASFKDVKFKIGPGDQLNKTIDYMSSPGTICLVHEDKAVVESDLQKIRQYEISNMYEIE